MPESLLSHVAMVAGVLMTALAVGKILSERRTPQSMAAWLLLMLLVPWAGLPLYLMLGGRKMEALKEKKSKVRLSRSATIPRTEFAIERAMVSLGIPPATTGNSVEFEFDGLSAYQSVTRLIQESRSSIDFATFIVSGDEVGQSVVDQLTDRARHGCRVRLLVDGIGSGKTPRRLFAPLVEAGGEVAWFNPVLHRPFYSRTNLRNHRKMILVDGECVWTGGRNIAREYLGPTPMEQRWRDLSFMIRGPAVAGFSEIFEADWAFARRSTPETRAQSPRAMTEDQLLQVVPSGPDVSQDVLLSGILTAIYRAERRIRIVTPYLVPPEAVTQALTLAIHRGVDVEIVLPEKSNHRLADWAREPHLGDIYHAGGHILLLPVMIHAKAMVFDEEVALAGSANLDERSLLLNYEVMAAFYSQSSVKQLSDWMDELGRTCTLWRPKGGRIRRMATGLAELAAPLL